MASPKKRTTHTWTNRASYTTAMATATLCTLLIVPIWPALTAGIASISIVVFSALFFIIGAFLLWGTPPRRVLLWLGLLASIAGLIFPQAAYFSAAQRTGSQLKFDIVQYLTFSGSTDIRPTKQPVYKQLKNQALRLAFYEGSRSDSRPVVVLMHGGAWRYGNHLETGEWPKRLTDAGYHVASIEYRLASGAHPTWQDAPADIHDAIKFLQVNAATLRVDTSRIHLLGQSAGGHLALLEAYRYGEVASVTALYAPIDLVLDYQTSRDKSAEQDFIGGPPEQFPSRYEAVSPIRYVSDHSPRTLMIQGTTDDLVHPRNTQLLNEALSTHGVAHTSVFLPLTGHSFENQRGGFGTQIAVQQVLQFLSQ